MTFTDTHAHLYSPEFTDDIDNVVNRAIAAGVHKILLPNIDEESIAQLQNLTKQYPEVFSPMMGLHPTSVKANYKNILSQIKKELETGHYIAVGEIGIDLYWDKTFATEQTDAFHAQIKMALDYNLPIVVHARDSFNEIFEVLNDYTQTNLKGVFHSFTGTTTDAEKIIDMGFYIGVGGISTFKNSKLQEIIAKIPLDKILLETDSPYLAPTPHRGKRNESSFIPHIALNLAQLKKTTLAEVALRTTQNAKNLFTI